MLHVSQFLSRRAALASVLVAVAVGSVVPQIARAGDPTYHWDIGEWSVCSKVCGGGIEARIVVCRDESGNTVDDSFCEPPKPAEFRECNTQSCFFWQTGQWGECSKECGGGTQERSVLSRDLSSGDFVDDSLCKDPKPAGTQACNTEPCPLTEVPATSAWGMAVMAMFCLTAGIMIQYRWLRPSH